MHLCMMVPVAVIQEDVRKELRQPADEAAHSLLAHRDVCTVQMGSLYAFIDDADTSVSIKLSPQITLSCCL